MTSYRWSTNVRSLLVGAVFLVLVAGCASVPSGPSASSGNKPTLVVQAPANGAVLPVGQNTTVSGAATDTVGVDHVSLFVDGVSLASTPSGAPAALVPFALAWLASPAGPHVLQVIAYRADGTASDPAIVNVVVGASASGLASGLGASLPVFSFPIASAPTLITPPPTKKPRASRMPATPTTATPTPTPTLPPPTMDATGNAPDDSNDEPYEITLIRRNTACPPIDTGVPVVASGCIWEQISGPAGDPLDELEFTQAPDTSYHYGLTSCSDTTGATAWSDAGDDLSAGYGCMQFNDKTSSGGNPGSQPIFVGFRTAGAQTYNLYQFTVYQCRFANCASQ